MKNGQSYKRKKKIGVENEQQVRSAASPPTEPLISAESPLIRAVRDSAGVVSAAGILLLAAYALWNLKPGWIWTIEDEEKKYPEADYNKAAKSSK